MIFMHNVPSPVRIFLFSGHHILQNKEAGLGGEVASWLSAQNFATFCMAFKTKSGVDYFSFQNIFHYIKVI
jgi:hypothetical protein